MVRRLRLEVLCSACFAERREEPATFSEHIRVGKLDRDLDLCDTCAGSLSLLALREVLAKLGTAPDEQPAETPKAARNPPVAAEEHPCPVEGCDYVGISRGAMRQHVQNNHHTTITALGIASTGRPLDEYDCPECGQTITGKRALGLHRYNRHGVRGKASGVSGRQEESLLPETG